MRPEEIAEAAAKLAAEHDLVLVEGAGGLLVRFDEAGGTLADAARLLGAPVLVVASAGLGTLNTTDLTARNCAAREAGRWRASSSAAGPTTPDLAARCNLADLPVVAGAPLLGAVPAGSGALAPADFRARAGSWLAPALGGGWDAVSFGTTGVAP